MSNRRQIIKEDFAESPFRSPESLNGCAAWYFLAHILCPDGKTGVLAQLVERLVRNEKVRGSNPLGSTSLYLNEVKAKAIVPKPGAGGPESNIARSFGLARR